MAHALGLARRGLGRVWPNPAVGCVLVGGGRVVGRGFTQPGGRPHAETVALAAAGQAARGLDLDPGGNLGRSAREVPVWLVHGHAAPAGARAAWAATGARLIEVAEASGALDPGAILAALGAAGLTRVFCEGGGQFAAALLAAGLVDEIALFTAGVALGADARPALGALGLGALAAAPRFRLGGVEQIGADTLSFWWRD